MDQELTDQELRSISEVKKVIHGSRTDGFPVSFTCRNPPAVPFWASSGHNPARNLVIYREFLCVIEPQTRYSRPNSGNSARFLNRSSVRHSIGEPRRLRSGAPQKFTEVVNVRGAGVADDEVPEASFRPRFGIEGQLRGERGSRIQPA